MPTHTHTHTYTHACTYTHTHTYRHAHRHRHRHKHKHTHTHTHAHTHTHTQTRTHACVCACACTHVRARTQRTPLFYDVILRLPTAAISGALPPSTQRPVLGSGPTCASPPRLTNPASRSVSQELLPDLPVTAPDLAACGAAEVRFRPPGRLCCRRCYAVLYRQHVAGDISFHAFPRRWLRVTRLAPDNRDRLTARPRWRRRPWREQVDLDRRIVGRA